MKSFLTTVLVCCLASATVTSAISVRTLPIPSALTTVAQTQRSEISAIPEIEKGGDYLVDEAGDFKTALLRKRQDKADDTKVPANKTVEEQLAELSKRVEFNKQVFDLFQVLNKQRLDSMDRGIELTGNIASMNGEALVRLEKDVQTILDKYKPVDELRREAGYVHTVQDGHNLGFELLARDVQEVFEGYDTSIEALTVTVAELLKRGGGSARVIAKLAPMPIVGVAFFLMM